MTTAPDSSDRDGGAGGWRLIVGTGSGAVPGVGPVAASGAVNMAIDQALLESLQQGGPPVLRFYAWQPACLSLGRNQAARGLYDADRLAAAGIDVVRRPTGGLAVLHDRELTYSVVSAPGPLGGARAAYASINRALVEGLRCLGIAAEQAAGLKIRGPVSQAAEPCFQAPAAGEVVAGGRKLVGSAQRCERGALLQHGSILLSGSQARVRDLLSRGVAPPASPAAPAPPAPPAAPEGSITLEELSGREPDVHAVIAAMCSGFERTFGTRLAPGPLGQRENVRAKQLVRRFGNDEWTWRR
ncbi:MAG: lipoate--protein ligase family protein [Gemmatimonadetes bacterium]|nr:lipoate--protein ligase family protein [Gemmatimonadota bacterium]